MLQRQFRRFAKIEQQQSDKKRFSPPQTQLQPDSFDPEVSFMDPAIKVHNYVINTNF